MRITFVCFSLLLCASIGGYSQTRADYQSAVNSQLPTYYFTMDGILNDTVGGSLPMGVNGTGGAFSTDYWGNSGSARLFHNSSDALIATNDIIAGGGPPGGNAGATNVGSLTMLFRTFNTADTSTGQRFLF